MPWHPELAFSASLVVISLKVSPCIVMALLHATSTAIPLGPPSGRIACSSGAVGGLQIPNPSPLGHLTTMAMLSTCLIRLTPA